MRHIVPIVLAVSLTDQHRRRPDRMSRRDFLSN